MGLDGIGRGFESREETIESFTQDGYDDNRIEEGNCKFYRSSGIGISLRNLLLALHLLQHSEPFHPLALELLFILLHAADQRALGADPMPELVEHDRDGDDGDLDQAEQGPRPVGVQGAIHGRPRQRQRPADERSDDGVAGERARGVNAVAMGQVVGRVYEHGRVAGAERDPG